MAARKSCTHMTWAEAKSKSGGPPITKNKEAGRIKADTHGKLLAAKIVAKAGPSVEEQIQNRQAAKQARKDEQRQAQLQAQRDAEKERQRVEAVARPHEQALVKLQELAEAFVLSSSHKDDDDDDERGDATVICESKQLQLDELLALQAIYVDTPDVLTVAHESEWEDLQTHLERWQEDPTMTESERSIVTHPPLRLAWKRSLDNPDEDDNDWVAHCFVEITMPSTYPIIETPPTIHIAWFMLTQKSLVVSDDKPLENWGVLDETAFLHALREHAQEWIGMPCLYEVMETWFSENLFRFISLSPAPLPC